MKIKKYILMISCLLGLNSNGQSLSFTKIIDMLESQDLKLINSKLRSNNFKIEDEKDEYNTQTLTYLKKGSLGIESIIIGKNDELFVIVYKPSEQKYYSVLKQKFLTKDFKYSYSAKGNIYYESSNLRLGLKDSSRIISFFVNINE